MMDKSEKPETDEEEIRKRTKAASGLRDEGKKSPNLKVLFAKYKGRPSPEDIADLMSAAEKRIREFFAALTQRVSEFLDRDVRQLRDVSKDELARINATLVDYKAQLETISREKMKRVAEMRKTLRTRIITADEVQSFVKYLDGKMTEAMRITQSVIDTMRKSKIADSFAADLQATVANYGKKVTTAFDELFTALKVTAEDLGKSVPDKATLMTKIPKMPTNSELQKMPSMLGNIFKRMGDSSSGAGDSANSRGGSLPPGTLREKLASLNLGKHFNSRTINGRANVAKATYLGAFLYFLYWKFKKSKS